MESKQKFLSKELFLAFSLIFLLMILSEFIYSFRNNSPYVLMYYLNKTKDYAKQSNIEKSYYFLSKTANIHLKSNSKKYPLVIPPKLDFNIDFSKEGLLFRNSVLDYLLKLDTESIIAHRESGLAKIFYDLGLIAYQSGQDNIIPDLFRSAIYLDPERGFYHVELVNYYLIVGKIQDAKNSLDFCFKFKTLKEHCNWYKNVSFDILSPFEVGFLESLNDNSYRI